MAPLTDENHESNTAEFYIASKVLFWAKQKGIEFKSLRGDALQRAKSQAHADILVDLYKNLDTIDTKASGGLAFSGLILTALTIAATSPLLQEYKLFLYILMIMTVAASVLFATVLWVHWSNATELKALELHAACVSYYKTRRGRTLRFQIGMAIQIMAIIITAIGMIDRIGVVEYFRDGGGRTATNDAYARPQHIEERSR